jgi:hypothetical protein
MKSSPHIRNVRIDNIPENVHDKAVAYPEKMKAPAAACENLRGPAALQ